MFSNEELVELFKNVNEGSYNTFEFISEMTLHNQKCNPLLKVDVIHHSQTAIYAYQNNVVIIELKN